MTSNNVSYAAILLSQGTVMELFSHVLEVPDGGSRLAWALFTHPWEDGRQYFFIGGNYLRRNQWDFSKQIISKAELDKRFTYNESAIGSARKGSRHTGSWFLVKPKKGMKAEDGQMFASATVS